ncbi:MAG: phosphoribosylanthranilate isomerase [Clostridiales bacterium]|nr:phosphoribosylanthranilate isomerase [Clostridiales bacterium]
MPDFIGFILSPGYRRSIDEKTAAALKERLAKGIKTVGVFVNDDISKINYFAESGIIDLVQLHGDESPSCCEKINAPVIKAFKCDEEISQKIKEYDTAFFLFDSGTGSGKAFDWKNIPKTNKPFFLAGGISEQNAAAAVKNIRPYAVDISTSVETNGFKDYYKMKKLTEMIRYE